MIHHRLERLEAPGAGLVSLWRVLDFDTVGGGACMLGPESFAKDGRRIAPRIIFSGPV